jgi:hypothetical protein
MCSSTLHNHSGRSSAINWPLRLHNSCARKRLHKASFNNSVRRPKTEKKNTTSRTWLSAEKLCRVVWHIFIDVSEDLTASITRVEKRVQRENYGKNWGNVYFGSTKKSITTLLEVSKASLARPSDKGNLLLVRVLSTSSNSLRQRREILILIHLR